MPDCFPSLVYSDAISRDSNRLIGDVVKATVFRSPWLDVYPTGVLDNNMGNVFRTSIQERTVLAGSQVNPVFTADISMCGAIPSPDLSGSKEFTLQLGSFRGRSNRICLKQARTAFMTAYKRQQEAMKDGVTRIVNAEGRAEALFFGGTKAVMDSTGSLDTNVTGGVLQISTPFAGARSPDSPPSFQAIKSIANLMKDVFGTQPFETSGSGPMVKTIFSNEVTDIFRNEVDTRADLRAGLTGRYKLGEQLLNSFYFEGPYREIGFAVDPQPLRAVAVSGGGSAVLSPSSAPFTTAWVPGYAPTDTSTLKLAIVEPEISVSSTNGVGSRPNPAWISALYEIGFILFDDSFTRLVPKVYTGEGEMKFPPVGLERLQWAVIQDNDCNRFMDFGDWVYEITRAYQPMHPEAACAVIYKRCPRLMGLTACS